MSAGNPPYLIKWYYYAIQIRLRFLLIMEINFQFVHVQINYWRLTFSTKPSKASTGDMCHSLPSRANYRTIPYKLGRGDYRRQVLNNNLSAFFYRRWISNANIFPIMVAIDGLGVTPTGTGWVLGTRDPESQWPHLTEIKNFNKSL